MYPNDPNDPLAILRANARPTFGSPIPDVQTPRALTPQGAIDHAEATPLPGSNPDGLLSILAGGQPLDQYSADDLQRARRAGLLQMGLATLAASQQRPMNQPHGLANALLEGLNAGQGGTGQALAQIRAQQLQAARRDIFAQLQPKAGDTPQAMYSRVTALFPRVLALGDPDLEKSVTQYLGQLGPLAKTGGKGQVVVPGQGGAYFVDAEGNARQIAPGVDKPDALGKATGIIGPDGKSYTVLYDRSGKEISRYPESPSGSQLGQYTPAEHRQVLGQFFQNTQDLRHRGSQIGAAYAAINSAAGAQPNSAAYASAISKFIQAVDQDKNLRQGMLEWFDRGLTPSVAEQVKKAWDKRAVGEFPPELVRGMMQHLDEMAGEFRDQYGRIQSEFGTLYPGITFPTAETYFGPARQASKPGNVNDLLRKHGGTIR